MKHGMLKPLVLALVLVAVPAWASQVDVAEGKGTLADQRAAIEAEIKGGDDYAEITPAQLAKARGLLDQMEGMLGDRQPAELTERQQAELFNLQDEVNQILLAAEEDSRRICRREKPTGSHRSQTVCRTVAERKRMQEESQEHLRARTTARGVPDVN